MERQEVEKYEIPREEKSETVKKSYPRSYYATKSDLDNMSLRSASPKIGAYKNISSWRK